ncbi:MAG TPA: hypothetical protein VES88_16525 [Gemmatimonadaceae bacterium]|nr:hypothetical protein [Gemmatimonadaceae bacterium]
MERIVSFWSDDAIVYPPGAPVLEGKWAIRNFVAGRLKTSASVSRGNRSTLSYPLEASDNGKQSCHLF